MIIASKHIFGNSSSNDAQICPRLTLQPLDYEDVHFTVISHDDMEESKAKYGLRRCAHIWAQIEAFSAHDHDTHFFPQNNVESF